MSIMQMAMISSRDTVVCSYIVNVVVKMILAVIAGENGCNEHPKERLS